jgi:hypothetical protein
VRVPVPVKRAEARCRERLVDGREVAHPRVALRHGAGELREAAHEAVVEQARPRRPAPVVDEPDDDVDSELLQAGHPFVRPREVGAPSAVRRRALPQDGVPDGLDPELREPIEILDARVMAGALQLIHIPVTDAVDGALDASPEIDPAASYHEPRASRPAPRGARSSLSDPAGEAGVRHRRERLGEVRPERLLRRRRYLGYRDLRRAVGVEEAVGLLIGVGELRVAITGQEREGVRRSERPRCHAGAAVAGSRGRSRRRPRAAAPSRGYRSGRSVV